VNLDIRPSLYNNIVLTGGNCLFPNFKQRLYVYFVFFGEIKNSISFFLFQRKWITIFDSRWLSNTYNITKQVDRLFSDKMKTNMFLLVQ